jgi:hypothetical protein
MLDAYAALLLCTAIAVAFAATAAAGTAAVRVLQDESNQRSSAPVQKTMQVWNVFFHCHHKLAGNY